LIQDKSNLGPLAPALLFEVVSASNGAIRLECRGECNFTVEELERKRKGSPRLDAAEKLLLEKLAAGPMDVNELIEQARSICSKRTLDEAKRNLGVKTNRKGNGQNHSVYWSL